MLPTTPRSWIGWRRSAPSVYPGWDGVYPVWDGSLQLLVDVKSDGETTYAAVEKELAKHPALMTHFSKGKVSTGRSLP
jgi:hypothetical protein